MVALGCTQVYGIRWPHAMSGAWLLLAIFPLFVPGHLDGFELALVGFLRIAGETGEFRNPFVHVREADRERIHIRKLVGQADGDVVEIVPVESVWHARPPGGVLSSKF
jgi:hypothetical protein